MAHYSPQPGDIVIDAIFGAGLSRPVPDEVETIIAAITKAGLPVIAVDLPSGLDGRSGQVLGAAFRAARTVTFMNRKPGHLLMPGRDLCGMLEVFDIGIPARIVRAHANGMVAENTPAQWQADLPATATDTHKYKRGHLVVFSGGATATGAARMSAMAGLKTGAGLVTIAGTGAGCQCGDADGDHATRGRSRGCVARLARRPAPFDLRPRPWLRRG
jgi:NAD(P)H-hydrate epimerase